jgi:hypothetical protein
MKSNITILSVMLCAIVTGQVLAANHKIKRGLLGADNVPKQTTLLRSALESGHHSPDSTVTRYDGIPVSKMEFSYNGDVIKETTYYRDHGTNTWNKNNSTEEYAFDANGNQILHIYTYNNNYAYKEEYSFSPKYGTLLWEKHSEYMDGKWTVEETSYQYDNNGFLIGGTVSQAGLSIPLTVTSTPDSLEIIASLGDTVYAKRVYHYDQGIVINRMDAFLPKAFKLLASETYYPLEDGTLQLDFATTYKYDDAGQLIEKIEIESVGTWTTGYTYDSTASMPPPPPPFDRYQKTEYAYDANGRKISELFSLSTDSGSYYSLYTERKYQYVNNRLETITDISNPSSPTNYITTTTFYYSADASIKSPEAAKVSNITATDGYITFIIPDQSAKTTLQLIDLTGRIILSKRAESGIPVPIPSLSGVYIYRILTESVSYSGKLLIRK